MSLMSVLAQGILSQVASKMGPQGSQITSAVIQMIAQQGQGQGATGLNNLISMFEKNGMGEIVKTWVGTGANSAINPQQIMQALGQDNIQNIASQVGISKDQASGQLANILPDIINQMTPNGQVENNVVGEIMRAFMGSKAA
ncbi:MAG: YidB family protein [Alphaproteobacteria bacterium]